MKVGSDGGHPINEVVLLLFGQLWGRISPALRNRTDARKESLLPGRRAHAERAGACAWPVPAEVQCVGTIINEITNAAAEQSRGISEVNGDVSQLDEMTQRNAALVEQAAAVAASMEQQSVGLESAVATFRLSRDLVAVE